VIRNFERAYGSQWQQNFREVNLFPFAAASIGQVHEARLTDGMKVALKMQYTGIANSIDSDLDNFKLLVDVLGVFPRGLYLNELIKVTRGELHWECDYEREASMQRLYREKLMASPEKFYAPKVIDKLSNKELLCSEFVNGVEIDTLINESQEVRNRVGSLMIELCFRELFEWQMMQCDPNPANYLYDTDKKILNLIDFGAGR
jgi:aarF domain-containing kinase